MTFTWCCAPGNQGPPLPFRLIRNRLSTHLAFEGPKLRQPAQFRNSRDQRHERPASRTIWRLCLWIRGDFFCGHWSEKLPAGANNFDPVEVHGIRSTEIGHYRPAGATWAAGLVRNAGPKGRETDLFGLQSPRHTPTLPFAIVQTGVPPHMKFEHYAHRRGHCRNS
jgi:hypothetical protein